MKKLIFITLVLFSCQEEINPIVPSNQDPVIWVSSNANITVTFYGEGFTQTIRHYPNERQYTQIRLPKGEINFLSCGKSGSFIHDGFKQIYIQCP